MAGVMRAVRSWAKDLGVRPTSRSSSRLQIAAASRSHGGVCRGARSLSDFPRDIQITNFVCLVTRLQPRHPRDEAPACVARCQQTAPRLVKLELHRFGDEARETGQVFVDRGGIDFGAVSSRLSGTRTQWVRRARSADALRLSALQECAPVIFGVLAVSRASSSVA